MKVNYISQLTEAMGRISDDYRLNPTHVSLYLALFQFWNLNRFTNPISINRSDVMKVSKIGSKTTYHRCINQLHKWNYIEYIPSKNPIRGSLVNMIVFKPSIKPNPKEIEPLSSASPKVGQVLGQVEVHNSPKNELVVGQVVVSSINNTNSINKINNKRKDELHLSNNPPKNNSKESSFLKNEERKDESHSSNTSTKESSNSFKKSISSKSNKRFTPPQLDEVKVYFKEQKSKEVEAIKFFNHFESNGWKVGGKASMKNWKAAARNWILRSAEFKKSQSPLTTRLNVNESKSYDIPL